MSLFPAYAQDSVEHYIDIQVKEASVSPGLEASLLASDEEPSRAASQDEHEPRAPPPSACDYYQDRARDTGNLRVSTLYFPGRPNYSGLSGCPALGSQEAPRRQARRRLKRYYDGGAAPPAPLDEEAAARAAGYRRLLADAPADEDLWLRFIRFQEAIGGAGEALKVAEEACLRCAAGGALQAERHRLARRHLPRDRYLDLLRADLADAKSAAERCGLWVRLLEALGASPAACSADALARAAAAAAADTRAYPPAYPRILHAYGSFLRAAGLWESLVLLIELVATMNFPASAAFPPPPAPEAEALAEERLLREEDAVLSSGLPLAVRWARLERARADAHWRPQPLAAMQADAQRAPVASDVAELLLPLADADAAFLLATRLLLLAKVPLLPGCGALAQHMGCGEALLPLLRAARRLPAAHPAHPARAAAPALRLLLDPPLHHAGFLRWVTALWEACCGWAGGARRTALVCWRLRWLHTMLLLLDMEEESGRAEARRIRKSARAILRAHGGAGGGAAGGGEAGGGAAAGAASLPFVQFARIEAVASGPAAGAAAATLAAKASLRDPQCPVEWRLYAARVLWELSGGAAPARWALATAALGRGGGVAGGAGGEDWAVPPPRALMDEASARCEERCQALEEEFSLEARLESEGVALAAALLPGAGEWAAARALLAAPARRRQLLQRADRPAPAGCSLAAQRYWEQAACALAGAAQAEQRGAAWARALAHRHPHSAYLSAAGGGAPAWAWGGAGEPTGAAAGTECSALGQLLPALLRAVGSGGAGPLRLAAAAARRACAGGGGAAAGAAWLELAARAPHCAQRPRRALYAVLDEYPQHKWLYVRGACWSAEGAALGDALLQRQLRLHALPDELGAPGADDERSETGAS